ncbi:unnamed protein product [Periconia digitata]|uniref:C2H2-type domain-containing protein n=1 Tax=Periconia digitata TaxID=1303443 RepID=A0A9W4XQG7_9PLEO|nr:unnamed protein product [Periconia digitata]
MSSRGQPTPPFNSPYQQAMKSNALVHSPAYPSPARSDSESSRYQPEGLGLYGFPHHFSSGSVSQSNNIMFPPSPHPTEAWANMSNGTPPMIQEPIVDPWTSGAYDHPVINSPIPWPQYEGSHRSSMSSPREASVFSGDGSEHGLVRVKLENGSGWASDEDALSMGTVAPGRLLNGHLYPQEYPHTSPYDSQSVSQRKRVDSPLQDHAEPRERKRRTKSTEEPKYACELCDKTFIRRYNKKSHMKRHDLGRHKPHKCNHGDCIQGFDRKTDLDRHIKSVHDKIRDLVCQKCGDSFSRKDTLRRHQDDGCRVKNQLSLRQIQETRSMRAVSNTQQAYYPSPRADFYPIPTSNAANYHPSEALVGYDSRSPPLFRSNNLGGHAGY